MSGYPPPPPGEWRCTCSNTRPAPFVDTPPLRWPTNRLRRSSWIPSSQRLPPATGLRSTPWVRAPWLWTPSWLWTWLWTARRHAAWPSASGLRLWRAPAAGCGYARTPKGRRWRDHGQGVSGRMVSEHTHALQLLPMHMHVHEVDASDDVAACQPALHLHAACGLDTHSAVARALMLQLGSPVRLLRA